ncbi:hypothetical protein PZB75_31245 (plasmid) [Streptomyces sp. AM 4-1-1]|uniref:hypothetical protein n=1 Tax=Streptomyces sp. AM 4-1-1 TaxID=3028710 RepID=UPI0023B935E7|nr:hypothetical protein [Streptomyces sp. AM 4-1-1]WEH37880.1 hypothetical protein PZB75_31245 [Streptomyces sp. AM 4-1-1]
MSSSPDQNAPHGAPEPACASIGKSRTVQLVRRGVPLAERADLRDVVVPGTADALTKFFVTGRDCE